MKNKEKKKNELLKKTYAKFTIKIIIWTITIPIFFVLIVEIINALDFQWLYDISWKRYYQFVRFFRNFTSSIYFFIIIFIVWIVGVFLFLYQLLKKVFSYTEAIFDASNELLEKSVYYIKLPTELEPFERQMNHLKKESEKNSWQSSRQTANRQKKEQQNNGPCNETPYTP